MKSISTINSAIMEKRNVQSFKCSSIIYLTVSVLSDHDVSLCFILLLTFQTCWATFQAENNVRSAPASCALTSLAPKP